MKRIALFLTVLVLAAPVFTQTNLPEHRFVSGDWSVSGSRVYQNDARARLAKVNIRLPQSGFMVYEFDARYESGAEDGHGGFGLHVFADSVINAPSWGTGNSYLLWLNYDENPASRSIPRGLSAQVYRSHTSTWMDLVTSIDLNSYAPLLTQENLSSPVPFRIAVDSATGEVRVYDPADAAGTGYYFFYVDRKDIPLKGNWAALRTNGIRLSFAVP